MRILALVTVCMLAMAAHAAPATGDDLGNFMAEKGLFDKLANQINEARQTLGNTASDLVIGAMGFLGVPYRRGGNNFNEGFDCSGFVRAIYAQSIGLLLPRKAEEQAAATQEIDHSELKPGDLVFYNTSRRAFSHVGIYVGDSKFIHSPTPGSVVRLEDMRLSYWQRRFDGARRVAAIQPGDAAPAFSPVSGIYPSTH